jgi:hypothetical protein
MCVFLQSHELMIVHWYILYRILKSKLYPKLLFYFGTKWVKGQDKRFLNGVLSATWIFENFVEVHCYPNVSIAYRILVTGPSAAKLFKTKIIEKTICDQ